MGCSRSWTRRSVAYGGGVLLLVAAVGCGEPQPPPLAQVSGVITLDDKPVPLALVTFYALFEGFGGEVIAEGVSDDDGRYVLSCPLGEGACIGRLKVTVCDAASPDDAREQSTAGQAAMRAHLRRLTNRPIGPKFSTLATTPLEVEVTAEGGPYNFVLSR